MGPLYLLLHLLNFVAPAVFTGAGLALLSHLLWRGKAARPSLASQAAINSIAGIAVLAAGLWYFGRDGKMATYGALVLACAASQWVAGRHWR